MADQLDNRPVFTIVMGCSGAGKSAWKRANQDRLPERYFDKDSIASGIGGWDTPSARARTDEYVNAEIDKALASEDNFGIESTYSGRPGPQLVERAIEAGYRIEGVYIGTSGPDINIERIRTRVENQAGHHVDPKRVPDRYRHSLHNLRQTADRFDELTIVDNTPERDRGSPTRRPSSCSRREGRRTRRGTRRPGSPPGRNASTCRWRAGNGQPRRPPAARRRRHGRRSETYPNRPRMRPGARRAQPRQRAVHGARATTRHPGEASRDEQREAADDHWAP